MKSLVALSLAIGFLMVISGTVCRAADLEDLALYFSFDETEGDKTEDLSGHDNTGTLMGDPELMDGKFGSGISLDGDGDYIEIADSPSLGFTDEITIEAWVNIADLTNRFFIWDDWKYKDDPKPLAVMFRVNREGTVTLWVSPDGASIGDDNKLLTEETIELGKWYHLAATFKAGDAVIYINGEESVSGTLTAGAIFDSQVSKHIGNYFGVPEYANGMIDELRIWNKSLSTDEIRASMESGGNTSAISGKDCLTTTWGDVKSVF